MEPVFNAILGWVVALVVVGTALVAFVKIMLRDL